MLVTAPVPSPRTPRASEFLLSTRPTVSERFTPTHATTTATAAYNNNSRVRFNSVALPSPIPDAVIKHKSLSATKANNNNDKNNNNNKLDENDESDGIITARRCHSDPNFLSPRSALLISTLQDLSASTSTVNNNNIIPNHICNNNNKPNDYTTDGVHMKTKLTASEKQPIIYETEIIKIPQRMTVHTEILEKWITNSVQLLLRNQRNSSNSMKAKLSAWVERPKFLINEHQKFKSRFLEECQRHHAHVHMTKGYLEVKCVFEILL